jgi:flagellar M-ring protein FliF
MALFVRLMGTPDYQAAVDEPGSRGRRKFRGATRCPGHSPSDQRGWNRVSVPRISCRCGPHGHRFGWERRTERNGFELFDKMSWGQTEFDQKVTYQRALEGELERSIETLGDVESARVHLVMPTDSVFLDRQRTAKASVILKLRAQ